MRRVLGLLVVRKLPGIPALSYPFKKWCTRDTRKREAPVDSALENTAVSKTPKLATWSGEADLG
jgi:hypothetical protein